MTDPLLVLAEPRRQRVLELVWDRERAAGDIAAAMPEVTFGAVSQHLKVLREAGLVAVRKDGRRRLYKADREALGPLAQYLTTMWRNRLSAFAAEAEAAERRKSEKDEPDEGGSDDED